MSRENSMGRYIFSEDDIAGWRYDYNGKKRPFIYNKEKDKNGYVYTKRNTDDDGYHAPYLVYRIGKKLGIDVPETELDDVAYRNEDSGWTRRNAFSNSSIVYDKDKFGVGGSKNEPYGWRPMVDYVSPATVKETYLLEKCSQNEATKRMIPMGDIQQMVDDYVDSTIYFLTTRGSKLVQKYSKNELDAIKQKLIDRLLFSLRFGIQGVSEIKLRDNSNAQLDWYYLASNNMFCLGDPENGIQEYIDMSEEEFKRLLDRSDRREYNCLLPEQGKEAPTSRDIIKYIYEHYPEQAQDFYRRLSQFTEKELETILRECTYMSESHRKLALREFRTRGQIFQQIHQQHTEEQGQDR